MSNTIHSTNNFDFLRIVAAIFVLFTHSFYLQSGQKNLQPFGFLGVGIFFIISGYLITQSWNSNPDFWRFLWKRFLRIFPALFVMCLFVIFIIGPFTTTLPLYQYFTKSTTYEYIETSSVFYFEHSTIPSVFENNPVKDIVNVSLGTLPIEFELYIIIAIIGVLGIITKRKYLLIAGFFGILIYTCLVLNTIPMLTSIYDFLNSIGIASFIIPFVKFTTYIPLSYPTFFLLGSIFYLYKDKINFDYKLVLSMATTLIICYFYLGMQNPIFLIFLTIFLPYIVLFFGSIKTPLNKFGDYGDYSYGIYIYGGPIQQMIVSKIPGIGSIELFFIALGISFIFAFISWNGIESRALKYKSIKFPDFEIFKKFIKNIE